MDRLRGSYDPFDGGRDGSPEEEDFGVESAPVDVGQSERRMQVRAYNHWASLLQHRNYPAPSDLDPRIPEFGPYSILLDFTVNRASPAIAYLGKALAEECGVAGQLPASIADVPQASLLNQITDHWAQTITNEAPVGFAAEFVNQRGATILYRGILLPFSIDDDTVDFIYGVINWKEQVDAQMASDLEDEIGRALGDPSAHRSGFPVAMADWADVPFAVSSQPDAVLSVVDTAAQADRLRAMAGCMLDDLPKDGPEFALALIRREADGTVRVLGEVPQEQALINQAVDKFLS